MGNNKEAGVFVASGFFRIAVYVGVAVLMIWLGRTAYGFGYDIFNQQPMSPGEGQEVTVVIKNGSSVYQIGRALEKKGLVEDAKIFFVQEKLSIYKGELKPGTYILSTAYDADRIMAILAGAEEDAVEGGS